MDKVIVPQRLGIGSMTQVAAKGPQDQDMYRNIDEKDSFFQFKHKPYVFFASNTVELDFNEDLYDFGSTVSLQMKYGDKFIADTISDLYLSVDLPALNQVARKIESSASTFTMSKKDFSIKEAYNSEMFNRPRDKVIKKLKNIPYKKIQENVKKIEVKTIYTPTPIPTITPTPTPLSRKVNKPTLKYLPIRTNKILPLSKHIITPTPKPQQEMITMKYRNDAFTNTPLPITLNTPTPVPEKYPLFTPIYDKSVFFDSPLTLKYSTKNNIPLSTPTITTSQTPLPSTPAPSTPTPLILNTPIEELYVHVIQNTPTPHMISTPIPKLIVTPSPVIHTPTPYRETPIPNTIHTPVPNHMITPMQSESEALRHTPISNTILTPIPTIISTPSPSDIKPFNIRETPTPNVIQTPIPKPNVTPSEFVHISTPVPHVNATPAPMIFVTPAPYEENVYTLKYNIMQIIVTPEPTPTPPPEQLVTPEPIIITTSTPTPTLTLTPTPTPTPMKPIILGTPTPVPLTIGQLITLKYNIPVFTTTPLPPDVMEPSPTPEILLHTPTPVPISTPNPPPVTPEPIIQTTPTPLIDTSPVTLKYKTMTLKYKTSTKNSSIVSKHIKSTYSKISPDSPYTPTPIPMKKINGFVPTPSPFIESKKNLMKSIRPTYLYNDTFYTNKIGFALIDRVTFSIDNEVITEYSGEDLELHHRMFVNKPHEAAIKEMVGIYDTETEIRNNGLTNKKLHIPLPLFWSKTYKQHFPLVAMTDSMIEVKVTFKKLEELSYVFGTTDTVYMRVGNNGSINFTVGQSNIITACEPLRAKLMVEHHILSPIEKTFFQRNMNEFLFRSPSKNIVPIKDKLNKLQMTFLQPTEWLAFCYRERGNGRYQYSRIESLRMYFNGVERIREPPNSEYYRILQKHLYFDNNASDNVYLYSFALKTRHGQPSGTINVSKLIKKELEIIVPDKTSYDDELIIFSSSYNVLKTDGTKGTLMFY